MYRLIAKQQARREQTHTMSLHILQKYEKVDSIITKQQVQNEEVKRKQTCSVSFVKVFKFQENKFKIVLKNF